MVMTKTRRRKGKSELGVVGPTVADYYRFRFLLPSPVEPTFGDFLVWREATVKGI